MPFLKNFFILRNTGILMELNYWLQTILKIMCNLPLTHRLMSTNLTSDSLLIRSGSLIEFFILFFPLVFNFLSSVSFHSQLYHLSLL